MPKSLALPTGLPDLEARIHLTAGPGEQHRFESGVTIKGREIQEKSHRSGAVKKYGEVLSELALNGMVPDEQRDQDWQAALLTSGTDGMRKAIDGLMGPDGNVVVNSDNFSNVAAGEVRAARGAEGLEVIDFERGEGLTVGSEEFERIAEMVREGTISTLHITENGTTTGANQRNAIEALVRIRDEADTDVVIIADAVSGQIVGAQREMLPDLMYAGFQKDMALGPVGAMMWLNRRAKQRCAKNAAKGLASTSKLGLLATIEKGKKGDMQTPQTPNLEAIVRATALWHEIAHEGLRETAAANQAKSLALVREWTSPEGELGRRGFTMLTTRADLQSPTSHVIQVPEGTNAKDIVAQLAEEGVIISAGYGKNFGTRELRVCPYSANEPSHVQRALGLIANAG